MELTPGQLRLVCDRPLLAAKTQAAATLTRNLHGLAGTLRAEVRGHAPGWVVPEGFDPEAFQVARGENLDETPYQYLDCPRHFSRDGVFAFRVLIWWGRSVNACWLLKGERLPVWRERLRALPVADRPDGVGLWLGADPWDWAGFTPLHRADWCAVAERDFVKLGIRRELSAPILAPDGLRDAAMMAFRAGQPLLSA
ncbi:MAG: hypothetical protein HZA24_02015 [Nitrospirae bacterium]|nr:hypothetical protein [Nitrospirota bacterium]